MKTEKLNKKATIISKNFIEDGFGGFNETQGIYNDIWCVADYVQTIDFNTKNQKLKKQIYKFIILDSASQINYSSKIIYDKKEFTVDQIDDSLSKKDPRTNYKTIIATTIC